jgi:1-acyl-sn-glycerol-3-phosphate acyltransferase
MPVDSSKQPHYPRPTPLYYRVTRWVVRIVALFWCRQRCLHREHVPLTGGVLLVCNHQSLLDPLIAALGLNRECSFMARDTLWKNKPFGKLISLYNAFPVKRDSADLAAVKETLRRLKAGQCITVFPEGTRTPTGRIGHMRAGVATIAKKARVPIVPALIEGAYDIWPRYAKLPRPAQAWVEYGKPITPEDMDRQSPEEITAQLHATLQSMHNALRTRYGLPPYDYDTD